MVERAPDATDLRDGRSGPEPRGPTVGTVTDGTWPLPVAGVPRWRAWLADPDRRVSVGISVVAFVLYRLVAARFPVEWDGAQLVMALDRFDVANGTPHPPGYWLYVAVGRTIRGSTSLDGTASLTMVSSVAAAATVGATHALGRAMGGRLLGVIAAALVLSSPFLWFYGASVDTYTLDALACTVLLSLAWHARPGSWHGLAAAGALGMSAGFRQTSLLLFAPLAVVAMARSARSLRTWAAGAGVGAVAIGSWSIPMLLEQPGGITAWREASDALLQGSVDQTAFFSGTAEVVTRNMTQGATYAAVTFLPAAIVGLVAWLQLVRWRRGPGRAQHGSPHGQRHGRGSVEATLLVALGAVPAVAFLVLIHFGKAGYLLAALPAGVLLLLAPVARLPRRTKPVVAVSALVVCLLSAQRFLFAPGVVPEPLVDATPLFVTSSVNGAPYPFTAEAVEASDEAAIAQLALADALDPARDVLVWGWLNGGERYRHATLLLPQFTTSFVRDSRHVHTARHGRWRTDPDTTLEVPVGGRAVFVLAHVPPDLEVLLAAGLAEEVRLATGSSVWAVEPGVTLLGVEVVEGDTAI